MKSFISHLGPTAALIGGIALVLFSGRLEASQEIPGFILGLALIVWSLVAFFESIHGAWKRHQDQKFQERLDKPWSHLNEIERQAKRQRLHTTNSK